MFRLYNAGRFVYELMYPIVSLYHGQLVSI